jgi:lysophospholipase L1-like esterase
VADSHRLVVACLGDSITEGSPQHDSRRGGNPESQWMYWAADERLEFRNYGIWGERTDEIADRLDEALRGADALVVQGGINDIAQGRPVERAVENLRTIVRGAKQRGVPVVVANVLPWNNGWPDAEAKIRRLNVVIAELAEGEGIALLDFHSALEDPDAPGRMQAELAHDDGDHPSVAGYRRLGEAVLDDLLRAFQPPQRPD